MYWTEDAGRWLHTRFPVTQFIPLALFLAVAGLAPAPPAQLLNWVLCGTLALALVLQFRLWDDIADLEYDRRTHPGRVLCQTRKLKPFLVAAATLSAVNAAVIAWLPGNGLKLTAYFALCTLLLAWYRWRPPAMSGSLINTQVILAKYPVIAWLVSTRTADIEPALLFSCLLSVYLIFNLFEILDDDRLRRSPAAAASFLAHLVLLACVWIALALWTRPHTGPLAWTLWAGIVLATLFLGLVGIRKRAEHAAARSSRGFFLIGMLAYLELAFEKSL